MPFAPLARDKIIDLTSRLDARGHLCWDVPQGNWTLLRLGHTSNGQDSHTGTPAGLGPECNKMDTAALDIHFKSLMEKLIADVGPLAGKTLVGTHIDSWEVKTQNWIPAFRQEL